MRRSTSTGRSGVPPSSVITYFAIPALLCVVATGCQTPNQPKEQLAPTVSTVGLNEIGEPCRVVPAETNPDFPAEAMTFRVYCGDWEQPSGTVIRVARSADPASLAAAGWWRDHLNGFANCEGPIESSILRNAPANALDCSLRAGSWPYQALAARMDRGTYVAETIPVAYPAVERTIGLLDGRVTADEGIQRGELSQEAKRLETRLAQGRYSAGDLEKYRDLLSLAQYYNFQGDYAEAETRYRQALEIQERVGPEDRGGLGFLYMHVALELSNQQRFDVADALFAKAEELVPYSLEPTDEARLVSYRAMHLANRGNADGALALSRSATTMRRELAKQQGFQPGSETIEQVDFAAFAPFTAQAGRSAGTISVVGSRTATAVGDVVQSQVAEAQLLLELGEVSEADAVLANAMATLDEQADVPRRWVPQVLVLQARAAELENDLSRAERLLNASVEVERSLYTESRTEGQAYVALGRIYKAQGREDAALSASRTGFQLLGRLGASVSYDDVYPFFSSALAVANRNPEKHEAIVAEMLEVSQLVQGSITAETMALAASRLASSDTEAGNLIRELQDSRRRRDESLEAITLARSDPTVLAPEVTLLEEEWAQLNAQVADLERQIQAAAPRYNQLIDRPVSAQDVRQSLRPDEAIVQILVGTEGGTAFYATSERIDAYSLDLTASEAEEQVRALRLPFDDTSTLHAFPASDSYSLYSRLFGPIGADLADMDHLIVVANGPFLSLPFGLFVVNEPPPINGLDYSGVSWMAHRHALTVAPSMQSFVNLRDTVQPSRATETFIGFGDFVPFGDTEVLLADLGLPRSCWEGVDSIAHAPPLPGTAAELRSVSQSIPGATGTSLVLGDAFSVDSVRAADLSNYRVVYFATHAMLPNSINCFAEPALQASRGPALVAPDDTLLTSSEILDLQMDADLVVLSACNTGGPGNEAGGESLSGLARSFFYAGARSMLVTHWYVPDKPTSMLMADTFERLSSQNLTFAEALRDSQAAFVRDYPQLSHPIAWASFTVVGDGGQTLSRQGVAALESPERVDTK